MKFSHPDRVPDAHSNCYYRRLHFILKALKHLYHLNLIKMINSTDPQTFQDGITVR